MSRPVRFRPLLPCLLTFSCADPLSRWPSRVSRQVYDSQKWVPLDSLPGAVARDRPVFLSDFPLLTINRFIPSSPSLPTRVPIRKPDAVAYRLVQTSN